MNSKIVKICCVLVMTMMFFTSAAYAGEFNLLITKDKAVSDKWFNVNKQDGPVLSRADQILQYQEFMVAVLFSDLERDENGRAKASYDLKIFNENQDIILEQKHIKVADSEIADDKIFRLGTELPVLAFDEMPGKYTIQATFHDEIANTQQTQQSDITLQKYSYSRYFSGNKAYENWVNRYHLNFATERALDGLLYFSRSDINNKNYYFACGFYSKLFNDNLYLVPHLLTLLPKQTDEAKSFLFALLPYIRYDFTTFIGQLDPADKDLYEKNKGKYFLASTDKVELNPVKIQDALYSAAQLDFLWGRFYAGGEYQPIQQLVKVLSLSGSPGNLEKYKQTKDARYEQALAKELIFQTACWSLQSHCQNNVQVKNYCNFIYDNEELSAGERQGLKKLLGR